jgi:DNA-binding NarL/FixJ family response regulator
LLVVEWKEACKRLKPKITVLLVDDHPLVRRGFRRIIEDESGITIIGEAGDGPEAIRLVRELQPNVVLMDCVLPEMDGLLATAEIVKSYPGTAVLMCSMHTEKSWVRRAVEAGARGYVSKGALDLELVGAIRRVAAGELVYAAAAPDRLTTPGKQRLNLSPRELEVLQLIVDGKSNPEIARQLKLSANTVATHRSNIMNTLRLHRTAELVAYAVRNGLARNS